MKKLNQKIVAIILIFCVSILSSTLIDALNVHAADSSTTSKATVIPLGSWELGNTFNISYEQKDSKKSSYSYNDLQNLYNDNSLAMQINKNELESNELEYQIYNQQYSSICDSIAQYKQLIADYKQLAKDYEAEMNASTGTQKQTAEKNMKQYLSLVKEYEAELSSAVSQKADVYEYRENCLFIKQNADILSNQSFVSSSVDFRDSIYQLKLLDEQYKLQGMYSDYYKLKADTQRINKSKDIAFQTDVDLYTADYDYYVKQQEYIKNQYNNGFELLASQCNITSTQSISIDVNFYSMRKIGLLGYNTFESYCTKIDTKKLQLENQIKIIDGKIDILKEYYSETSNPLRLATSKKMKATLELKKWLIQRRGILQKEYANYKAKYLEIEINEKKAKALYEKYIIMLNKYNYGLTNRPALNEVELNYIQGRCNAWNTIYEFSKALSNVERYMSGNFA